MPEDNPAQAPSEEALAVIDRAFQNAHEKYHVAVTVLLTWERTELALEIDAFAARCLTAAPAQEPSEGALAFCSRWLPTGTPENMIREAALELDAQIREALREAEELNRQLRDDARPKNTDEPCTI